MRLLLDEMHAAAIAARLRGDGIDAIAVTEDRALRGTSDEHLFRWATDHDRAVVTENVRDFARIAGRWAGESRAHAGIVFTNPTRFHRGSGAYPDDVASALAALARTGWQPFPGEVRWL